MISKRDYMWDNIKAILIFLVVLGHFLEKLPMDFEFGTKLDFIIYSFHMPAFIFVSGFWSKSYCKDGKVRNEKICYFAAYYLIFQLLFTLIITLLDTSHTFSILEPNIGLWYLLAMIVYYLLIPVVEKLPSTAVITVFLILGLFIGCEKNAGSFCGVSRIFVFAPFFFIGYYMPLSVVEKMRNIKHRVLIGLCALGANLSICLTSAKAFRFSVLYGKANYKALGVSVLKGIGLRYLNWLAGAFMIIALLLLVSSAKNIFSVIGERSIQAYLLHFPLIIYLVKKDLTNIIMIDTAWEFILAVVCAGLFTWFLSLKIFSYPFKWIRMGVDKILSLLQKSTQ